VVRNLAVHYLAARISQAGELQNQKRSQLQSEAAAL